MAQVLMVIAHPLTDSLCQYLAQQVRQELQRLQHQVIVDDLYAQAFNPCLSASERGDYYQALQPSSDTAPYTQRLLNAEHLILIFPTWWYGFPAILKGWFDRVWLPDQAFSYSAQGTLIPKLQHLKQVLAITSLGSPHWYDRWFAHYPIKRTLKHGILASCARTKLHYLPLYQVKAASPTQIERHLTHIRGLLQRL